MSKAGSGARDFVRFSAATAVLVSLLTSTVATHLGQDPLALVSLTLLALCAAGGPVAAAAVALLDHGDASDR